MKFLLLASCIILFDCSARASNSNNDQLRRMQREINKLKVRDGALRKDYDEIIGSLEEDYDETISIINIKYRLESRVEATFSTLLPEDMASKSPGVVGVVDLNIAPGYDEFTVNVPVEFSARLKEDMIINDSPVIFRTVDKNTGDGYDEITGVFRPSVDGIYVLMFYGLVQGTSLDHVYIKQNNVRLCQGSLLSDQSDTSTCTAIGELTDGDTVRVTGDSAFLRLSGEFSRGYLLTIVKNCAQLSYTLTEDYPILTGSTP